MANDLDLQKQKIEAAGKLQLLWLERMEHLFSTGAISSADLATLERFFARNGFSVDPAALPEGLRQKMMPTPDVDLEGDVLPFRRNTG